MGSIENITFLMISNSKLLKNKFIESISNELNHFSLMTKSVETIKSVSERINVSCFVCDYSLIKTSDKTHYTQIVDANDKNLINTLIYKTVESIGTKNFKFFVNGIVYLYDESQSDTFSYLQSIHNELRNNYGNLIANENFKCLLCDMKNAINLNENKSGMPVQSRQQDSLISLVDKFLREFKNIQYVAQEYEYSIMGSKPIETNENSFKVKTSFDLLVSRAVAANIEDKVQLKNKSETEMFLNIRTDSNSLTSRLDSSSNQFITVASKNPKKAISKRSYVGETKNNVRNGILIL